MAAIAYYLLLPLLYGISLLPFPVLYLISDFLYLMVYKIFGYRKKVVLQNLKNSFPEKSDAELKKIMDRFYQFFCDMVLETLKTLTIKEKALRKRISFDDVSVFEKYYNEKQSVIIVMGHLGNWELGGARFSIVPLHRLYVIYHPLKNKYFNNLIVHMRTRLGNRLYAMNETLRGMVRDRGEITATAFIADQTPQPQGAYWTNFLNQDTPVFTGTEKLAQKFNYPVIYLSITQPKRGYYKMEAELLVADPKNTAENEISELHTRRLEKDIKENPAIWLWTHRRWKHKRST